MAVRWRHGADRYRHAAQLRTFLRCPVDVLVICPDAKSAFWYAQPVRTSLPGYTHLPVVPAITDTDAAAANPAVAALSVAYHGTRPGVPEAVAAGLRKLPPDRAAQYREYAFNMSPLAVQRILEQLMTSNARPVYSPFAKEHYGRGKREGKKEGRREGRGEAILDVLEARGLDVSEAARERITSCTDLRQLRKWLKRSVTAEKTDGLFAW